MNQALNNPMSCVKNRTASGCKRLSRGMICLTGCLLFGGHLCLVRHASGGEWTVRNPSQLAIIEKSEAADKTKAKAVDPDRKKMFRRTLKIDFIYRPAQGGEQKTVLNQKTPTPDGWEPYDGSIYTPQRGYGWLIDLRGTGRDRGTRGIIILPDGTKTSPHELNRPELAHFEGRHRENRPLVFRIDLPDGWYRVTCASVDPDHTRGKPLVDQRTFKCRSQDVVFAGANFGAPVVVGGRQLVESSGIVEVTDSHLRIVVGDPAYAGWTWGHSGPWYAELARWWRFEYNYANGWRQRLTRTVDPGFHSLALNSLIVEPAVVPVASGAVVFRDFFNRDDSSDANAGIPPGKHWKHTKLHPRLGDSLGMELRHASIAVTGIDQRPGVAGLLQQQLSPAQGTIRYSTRVSLFTGEGSQKHSGIQEAGIVLLAEPPEPGEFNSTFVGVRFDSSRADTKGGLVYSVGDGQEKYRTRIEVPDTALPFRITEGEFEIIVEHDVIRNVLSRIKINGVDVTDLWSLGDRMQRIGRGLFGIRSAIHNTNPRVSLEQFYWYYRVESLTRPHGNGRTHTAQTGARKRGTPALVLIQ